MKNLIALALLIVSSTSFAASRYFYDVQKLQAILESKEVEAKLGMASLESIELMKIDDANRTITYQLKAAQGMCIATVTLSYDDGLSPNYKVADVSDLLCASPGKRR